MSFKKENVPNVKLQKKGFITLLQSSFGQRQNSQQQLIPLLIPLCVGLFRAFLTRFFQQVWRISTTYASKLSSSQRVVVPSTSFTNLCGGQSFLLGANNRMLPFVMCHIATLHRPSFIFLKWKRSPPTPCTSPLITTFFLSFGSNKSTLSPQASYQWIIA